MQGWLHAWASPAVDGDGALRCPLVERVAKARGLPIDAIRSRERPSLAGIGTPEELAGAVEAGAALADALRQGEQVAIHGDYDADGICASAILVHVLRAARPDAAPFAHVPLRLSEGYGLSSSALEQFASRGATTVVTVDCGITALAEARRARELGMRLVVTDHHALARDPSGGVALPEADFIVHPDLDPASPRQARRQPAETPVCGALVAWKVAWSFARHWSGGEPVEAGLRDALLQTLALAALGTIADVMPMAGENRAVVAAGLSRMASSGIPGLASLVRASGIRRGAALDAESVQFSVAPILNASGRLGDANDAVALLSMPAQLEPFRAFGEPPMEAARRADERAASFVQLNDRRKALERVMHDEAVARIESEGLGRSRGAVVLADPSWSRGIVGIASTRVAEHAGVPCVLLSIEDGMCHGSARSVGGYSILEGLRACAPHLVRWGGHAAAAGLSLRESDLPAFREALSDHAAAHASRSAARPRPIDCIADAQDIDVSAVRRMATLGPFGEAWPIPTLLLRGTRIVGRPRIFGKRGEHVEFVVAVDGRERRELRCIWWRQAGRIDQLRTGMQLDLVTQLKVDDHPSRGGVLAQLRDVVSAATG